MRQSSKYQLFKSLVSLKHPKCLSKFKVSLKYKNVSKRFKVFQLWAPYTKVTTTTKSKTTILFCGGITKAQPDQIKSFELLQRAWDATDCSLKHTACL